MRTRSGAGGGGKPPGKPTLPGPTITIAKKKPKPKKVVKLTRDQAYAALRALGIGLAANTAQFVDLTGLTLHVDQRAEFLDRAVNVNTGRMITNARFGSSYRTAWDAQDELFSTASTRYFIQGLTGNLARARVGTQVWARWRRMVDLISALRIPTRFSGFSVRGLVMQHPTRAGAGVFSRRQVEGPHGHYDSQRVQYIGRAVQAALAAGAGFDEQLRVGMRAAIEFSLNYFTAPVTSNNVKPFSARAAVRSDDAEMQNQLEARERIKEIYVQLGGTLRDLPAGQAAETPEASWDRDWQQSLTITDDEPFPVAPPSPRRLRRGANTTPPAGSGVTVPASGSAALRNASPPAPSSSAVSTPTSTVATRRSSPRLAARPPASTATTLFSGPSALVASPSPWPSSLSSASYGPQAETIVGDVMLGVAQAVGVALVAPELFKPVELKSLSLAWTDPVVEHLPDDSVASEDPGSSDLRDVAPMELVAQGPVSAELVAQDIPDGIGRAAFELTESPIPDLTWEDVLARLPEVPSFSGGGARELTSDMFPSVPDTIPGLRALDPDVLSPDMFPSVPNSIPGLQPLDTEALTLDMFPSVPGMKTMSPEELELALPDVPNTPLGSAELRPFDAENLSADMFPTVPSGGLGVSTEAAGGEAAGASVADLAVLAL